MNTSTGNDSKAAAAKIAALEKSISRLRSKIKAHYGENIIQNIRGYGYKLSRGLICASHFHPIKEGSSRE